MYDHISWEEDAMVIVFPSHKGDQEGKHCNPKHIYANRSNPEICPILSFAIYIWTIGFRRTGSKRVVFGETDDTEVRFSKWLKNVFGKYSEELLAMGLIIMEIGTHSFRKGISTFLQSIPGGPSSTSIYLRAGWSLGPVQSRYILEGGGGDQLCGRAATGLPLTEASFADLPPHFDVSNGPVMSLAEWEDILPGYATFYPSSFRQVIPFLLASIVFHKDYLRTKFKSNHHFFLQRIWTSGLVDRLSNNVLVGCGRHPISRMFAAGIPPHILLANQIIALENSVHNLKVNIINRLEKLPDDLKTVLLENFQINGALPITHTQVIEMMSDLKASLIDAIKEKTDANRNYNGCVNLNSIGENLNNFTNNNNKSWTWKGRIHCVPQDFKFPK
jgi:hypothetical protein